MAELTDHESIGRACYCEQTEQLFNARPMLNVTVGMLFSYVRKNSGPNLMEPFDTPGKQPVRKCTIQDNMLISVQLVACEPVLGAEPHTPCC